MVVAEMTSERETAIEDDAFDLLHCFYDGVDVYVRQLAVEIAIEQGSFDDDGKTVVITKDHVQDAGNRAVSALKDLLKLELPPSARDSAKSMTNCFHSETSP